MQKTVVKPAWQTIRKFFVPYSIMVLTAPVVLILAALFSKRADIQRVPLICCCLGAIVLAYLTGYLVFFSRRLIFDGKKLTFYKYFVPVKSFTVEEIKQVEYLPEAKLLMINRYHGFITRFYPEKELENLLSLLPQDK